MTAEESSGDACEKTGGFLCRADRRCLSNSSVCNGIVDCSDASDELNCSGLNPDVFAKPCYYTLLCCCCCCHLCMVGNSIISFCNIQVVYRTYVYLCFLSTIMLQKPWPCQDPTGGAYSALPDLLAGGEGIDDPFSKNPTPCCHPCEPRVWSFDPHFDPPLLF